MLFLPTVAAAKVARTHPSLAEAVRRLKPPPAARALPRLLLLTDRQRLPDPVAAVGRLPPGAALIIRDYEAGDRRTLVARLRPVCRRRRVRLLIAGDWRLAATVGADGLHLPEWQVRSGVRPPAALRRRWLVTAAAHSPAAVQRAAALGVDAVLVSPVFPTASHPGAPVLGPVRFARLVRLSPVPVYALGGITPLTAARLAGSGAAGVAGIGGLSPPPPRSRTPR